MNRVIRFRGRRLNDSQWVKGELHIQHCNKVHIHPVCGMGSVNIDLNTAGQFSGLYAMGHTPIYEGDILRREDTKVVVVFRHGAFGYMVPWDNETFIAFATNYNYDFWKNDEDDNWKVVGNIHDNPKLIEGYEIYDNEIP